MRTNSVFGRGGSIVSLCTLVLTLFMYQNSRAQLDSPYTYLNDVEFYTGYFYPKAFNALPLPDGSDSDTLSFSEFTQIMYQLNQAQLEADFPQPAQLRNGSQENPAVTTLYVADLDIHDFSTTAIDNSQLSYSGGFFHDLTGENDSPYVVRHAFASGIMTDELLGDQHSFRLPAANYFTNLPLPESIEVDFDDGLGYRPVSFGEAVDVTYNDLTDGAVELKFLRVRIYRDGEELRSVMSFQLRGGGDSPHLPPAEWITEGQFDNPEFPWQFSVEANGRTVKANAYTLWSDDGILDKPFIFVEGIDFRNDHWPLRNGAFGWDQFRTGAGGYLFLEDMTVMFDELRELNYDLILLDFWKGDDWMGDNAMLLVELIQLVNESKSGDESLVVAGASMGGQITRYALRHMEINDIPHCTRLWISLDSPHLGANLPLSLQESIKWLASYKSEAEIFMNEYLLEPATRQMLNVQAQLLDIRDAWYNELEQMGWPENLWSVGIANGNGHGIGPDIYPGQPFIQYDCGFWYTEPVARFHMYALPGEVHVSNDPPFEPYYKIAEVIISESPEGILSYLENGANEQFGTIIKNENYINSENYDIAPGGLRNSLSEFVAAVSGSLGPCGSISAYEGWHTFIPTVSALAMSGTPVTANVHNVLEANPDATPFDMVHYASGSTNQIHSQLSDTPGGNIDFSMSQVLNGEDHIGGELTSASPANGVFNYGMSGDFIFHGVHVHSGGQLNINSSSTNFHFDEGSLHQQHVEMATSTCGSVSVIDNGGSLSIGDYYVPYTASLRIENMGIIQLGSGGLLQINPASSLIVADGGELWLDGGELKLTENAILKIEQGGKLMVGADTDISSLIGTGQIHVSGEIIYVQNYADLFLQSNDNAGVTLYFDDETTQFLGNFSNKLIIHSSVSDQIVAHIGFGAWMRPDWQLGELEINGGRVVVNGQLQGICKTDFDNVIFEGSGAVRIEAANDIDNCSFNGVELESVFTSNLVLHVDGCSFEEGSRIKATGGGFVVRNSAFGPGSIGSTLKGHNLTLPSAVHQTTFTSANEAVFDDSNVDLTLRLCTFNGNQIAVQKIGGRLNLRCNTFSNSDWYAVIAGQYCWLNMSSNHAAGYNHFSGNTVNVLLEEASAIDLAMGYNTLADFTEMNLLGELAGRYCQTGSAAIVTLDASRNAWTSVGSPVAPNLAYIDLSTWNDCEIILTDSSPQISASCGQYDSGSIHPVKSLFSKPSTSVSEKEITMFKDGEEDPGEPIIYTQDIDGLTLSEALSLAAGYCTSWNDGGDDAMAVNLFHQILTHPLDRHNPEVRWKSKWGHRYMKIALESLYQIDELLPDENMDSFDAADGMYVDVLNAMTDTLITDSTYTDQFYLEMDKAQFFRLTGNLAMCEQLLLATDNCQLDSLEQAHLNFWLGRVQQEMALMEDLEDHVQDSETYPVDSTSFVDALSFVSSQYYFGAWIYGPNDVSYAVCGDGGYKNQMADSSLDIYPNPASGDVWLNVSDSGNYSLELLDKQGKVLMNQSLYLDKGSMRLSLPDSMSNGTYLIRILSPHRLFVKKLVLLR